MNPPSLTIRQKDKLTLFVTGIGTGVGKTVCSAVLTAYFRADYWKPIQSGDLDESDSMKIRQWTTGNPFCHPETYRFRLAASPHQSAKEEKTIIDLERFIIPQTDHHLIIEGAGGLMVPLNEDTFMIDLIEKLDIPVALVVRNYLGCINHTLLSVMALKQKNLQLSYLILNGSFPPDTERIICNAAAADTHIIRIPEIENITKENIECITHRLTLIQ